MAALVVLGVLLVAVLVSLMVGREPLSVGRVLAGLAGDDHAARDIVRGLRLDRTLVALTVGLALGAAGALMQALTRNPLADPGLLGVNAGAAAAVVTGIAFLDVTEPRAQIGFALVGAALASVVVYVLGSGGRAAATPMRLALAGAALTAVLTAYVNGVALSDQRSFDTMRFWVVGSVVSREISVLVDVLPFLVAGAVLALCVAPSLNAIALGEDTGRALGARLGRTRVLTAVAITLLCGAATAVAGPIGFLGLTVPHVARFLAGPDQRWVVPLSMGLAATLLVAADTVGRVVTGHREIEAGVMTAFIGAPVFIALVRRRRLVHL
ncbi:iron chelate uptake ABC transporter family permease subunit [Nocardioides sp. TF02-7]|uniref:FecCD family ABC transporter permease n=1 Tax=Nocardioides sp. TF02-7 TaxID=2917724 RepID=UPI001F06EF07|nr:iron chelate uptake ABC transporter family permease subunit [Nocardioides sp. TF02-7]UMG94373.1 iron chelate uptake ABC transporter family permease subunit [Nocardioides sp. TF02-7]